MTAPAGSTPTPSHDRRSAGRGRRIAGSILGALAMLVVGSLLGALIDVAGSNDKLATSTENLADATADQADVLARRAVLVEYVGLAMAAIDCRLSVDEHFYALIADALLLDEDDAAAGAALAAALSDAADQLDQLDAGELCPFPPPPDFDNLPPTPTTEGTP